MTFTALIALCAFVMALVGSRIVITAMRQRRHNLGYDRLPDGAPGKPPYAIQDGGIALVFAVLICLAVMDLSYGVLLAMLALVVVLLLKKLLPVPWLVIMLLQILAIGVPLSNAPPTFGSFLIPWVDTLLTGAIWLWFMHMFASMDKLEGLCASALIWVCLGLALVASLAGQFPDAFTSHALVIAAASWGFLWWNKPPARIMMGEVGAIPLGYMLSYMLFTAYHSGYGYAAAILPAYIVLDHALSWVRRTWKNKPMRRDHGEYYYQLALKNGRSDKFVLRSILGISVILMFLASYLEIEHELALFNVLLAYLSVFMLLGFFANDKEKGNVKEGTDE